MNLVAYIDGASLGNPGDAGYGVVIKGDDGTSVKSVGRYIGKATNNVAEYQGLIGCLELMDKQVAFLTVYSDSQLLVNQMNGSYKIKQPHLKTLHDRIASILKNGSLQLRIIHIPRENNKEADRLAKRAAERRADIDC